LTPGLPTRIVADHLQFLENGRRVLVARNRPNLIRKEPLPNDSWVFDISPDNRPPAELSLIAQVLSGRQGAELGAGLPWELAALKQAWQRLRESGAADFRTTLAEVLAWHQAEARFAEDSRRWVTARFHLARLAEFLPGDSDVMQRLARAEAQISSDSAGSR
jgi:ribonuclease D